MSVNPFDDLMAVPQEAFRLVFHAQDVMQMRILQFVLGQGTSKEASAMIAEKANAFVDAAIVAAQLFTYGRPASAPLCVLRCYSERVEANRSRLTESLSSP